MKDLLIGIAGNLIADVAWLWVIRVMHSRQIKIIEDLFSPDTPGGMSDIIERINNGNKSAP